MKITIIGHGYVGLVSAAVFSDFGNTVYVVGRDKEKIERLKKGDIIIYEPGLEELVKRNIEAGRLIFTLDYSESVPFSDIVFTAVGTPPKETGEADLSNVMKVVENVAQHLNGYTVIATKSTVPVGTNKKIKAILMQKCPEKTEFDIASVPEFLREGSAIGDTKFPDRVVIGTESSRAQKMLLELHEPIGGERVLTNLETAEMIKYAANSFLANKISYANAIAKLSELVGADGPKVLEGIGFDKRIGNLFLNPGPGYGGSCFPKDVKALIAIAREYNYDFKLLKEVENVNAQAQADIIDKVTKKIGSSLEGKSIGILGLAFKPNTDDMREAPAITVINGLVRLGAKIKAFDPEAMENAKNVLSGIEYVEDVYEVASGADLLIALTEWDEFKEIDFTKILSVMRGNAIIDARNMYDKDKLINKGFDYTGVGR